MSQVYALVIRAEGTTRIGRLGRVEFRGTYVYVGSALGKAGHRRIERHREIAAGRRTGGFWHIDGLLELGELRAIVAAPTRGRKECAVARGIGELAAETVLKFGSSDCRCRSHLFRLEDADAVRRVSRVMRREELEPEATVLCGPP